MVALFLQELRQVVGLLCEPRGVLVLRSHLAQLVLEHSDAARLRADDRRSGTDLVAQRLEDALEVARG